jgi:hypothetical protein
MTKGVEPRLGIAEHFENVPGEIFFDFIMARDGL